VQVVERLLAKWPEDRPASAAKVAELLAPFVKGSGDVLAAAALAEAAAPASAPVVSLPPTTLAQPVPRRADAATLGAIDWVALARRHWIATAGIGVVLAALACFGIAQMWPPGDNGGGPDEARKNIASKPGGVYPQGMASAAKVILVLPQRNYWDDDYNRLRPALEAAGAKVRVASSAWTAATGAKGGSVRPDMLLDRIPALDVDAVVFLGTAGGKGNEFSDDPAHSAVAKQLAGDMVAQGKTVAAICAGPAVLAHAGLLRGRRATGYPAIHDTLRQQGATLIDAPSEPVVLDNHVLTARDWNAAEELAERIVAEVRKQKTESSR
jgi:protease I